MSTKATAARIYEYGEPDVFRFETMDVPDPVGHEVLVRNTVIGLNFVDIYYRRGTLPNSSFPSSRRRVMRSSNCQDAHAAQNPSLETPEGPLFEPGLLSVILSTLTGEHDSRRHRSSENHCCDGLHYIGGLGHSSLYFETFHHVSPRRLRNGKYESSTSPQLRRARSAPLRRCTAPNPRIR